ncbi:MAG: hypothetical protein IJZ89_00325 [Clostridia bacterium]|nr:hypothetical protein [Clostridia bacterium]
MGEIEKDLITRSYDTICSNIYEPNKYFWGKYRLISPGKCCFKGVWNWDTAFHAIGTSRWDTELAKENILGFLAYQCEDGMLPDVLREDGKVAKKSSKPPIFAWATEIVYKRDGDTEFLREAYPSLVKHVAFWENERSEDGLFHYDAQNKDEEKYLRQIGFETGWDNSIRWDNGAKNLWAIDLNCFMVMEYRALASIAKELQHFGEAVLWLEKEKRLIGLIKERMWNSEKHMYNDVNFETGEISSVLTPAIFMPLYIGIASPEQAEDMAKIAEKDFRGRMPTVNFENPCYGRGYWRGTTWLNVAFFAAKGLKNYGLPVADEIRKNILEMCFNEREGICENYDSITGKGLCCKNFSWSSVFLIEFILGFEE